MKFPSNLSSRDVCQNDKTDLYVIFISMNIFDENDITKLQKDRDRAVEKKRREADRAEHNAQVFDELVSYSEGLLLEFAAKASAFAEAEQRPKGMLGTVAVYPIIAPKDIGHGITEDEYVWAWVTKDGKGYGRYEKHSEGHHYYPIAYNFGYRAFNRKAMVVCPIRAVALYITNEVVHQQSSKKLSLESNQKVLKNIIMTGLKNL